MLVPRQSRTFIINGPRFVARFPYPRGFIGHSDHSASSPRGDSNTNSTPPHHTRTSPPNGQTSPSQWFQDPGSPLEWANRVIPVTHPLPRARFLRGPVPPLEPGTTLHQFIGSNVDLTHTTSPTCRALGAWGLDHRGQESLTHPHSPINFLAELPLARDGRRERITVGRQRS